MLPRRYIRPSKLRKPINDKLRVAAEQRLAHLRVNLRLHPLDPPPSSIFDASSPHEAALRSLGLLDFARADLQSEALRPDLVAQLIAYYDPAQRRSFVWDARVGMCRKDFARAFSLPPNPAPWSPRPDVDPAALVSAVLEFMRVYIPPRFTQEVAAAEAAVKDGSAHRVDWTGLIWGLVEKEILELPGRGDGVCYYGAYLQRLIWVQKPQLFEVEPLEEEERGEVAPEVSLDTDKNKQDGNDKNKQDVNAGAGSKSLQEQTAPHSAPELTGCTREKRQRTNSSIDDFHERYLSLKREEIDRFAAIEERKLEDPYSIQKCIAALEALQDLQMGDILKAADLFTDNKDNREVFLSFSNDKLRRGWLIRKIQNT